MIGSSADESGLLDISRNELSFTIGRLNHVLLCPTKHRSLALANALFDRLANTSMIPFLHMEKFYIGQDSCRKLISPTA